MKHGDPQIRIQAIRASETLYKAGDRSFATDYKAMAKDADTDVVMQALLTLNTLKVADGKAVITAALESNKTKGVQLVTNAMLKPPANTGRGAAIMEGIAPYTAEERATLDKGQEIYTQVCFACHGDDGRGAKVPGAQNEALLGPPLASSPRVLGHQDYVVKAVLHGLTGPIDGVAYPDVMIGMGQNTDEWMAAITSYISNSFGNRASLVLAGGCEARARGDRGAQGPVDDGRARGVAAEADGRRSQVEADGEPQHRHRDQRAEHPAVDVRAAQEAGMWLQVELPEPTMLTEIAFESAVAAVQQGPAVRGAPTRIGVRARSRACRASRAATRCSCRWMARRGVRPSPRVRAPAPRRSSRSRPRARSSCESRRPRPPSNAPPLSVRRLRLFVPGTLKRDSQP